MAKGVAVILQFKSSLMALGFVKVFFNGRATTEAVLDDLNHKNSCKPSPAWHAQVLAERVREIEAGNTTPWEEAKIHILAKAAQIKQDRTRADDDRLD